MACPSNRIPKCFMIFGDDSEMESGPLPKGEEVLFFLEKLSASTSKLKIVTEIVGRRTIAEGMK